MVMRMHNPPHPGEVLKGLYMEPAGVSVTDFACQLGVDRKTISRLVNGRSGVTAEMALRLSKVLNTTPEVWLGMQQDYDLWHAEQDHKAELQTIRPMPRPEVERRPIA